MIGVSALLGDVRAAAAAKVASMLEPPLRPERELRQAATAAASPEEIDRIVGLARRLGGKGAHAGDAYLSHPFRVARIALALEPLPSTATFVVGALHNVYEISGANERELVELGVPDAAARAIRFLTIDRARENDVVYLADFYGAIEGQGLALVRTADKLDNILGLELLEQGPIKTSYIDLAEHFVGPMARRWSADLGDYFAHAIEFARRTPCDAEKLARYRAFTGAP